MTQKTILQALILLAFSLTANAQQDTAFWFVAPETAQAANNLDRPVAFRFSTYGSPAIVKVSQPANPAFPVQTISIPANAGGMLEFPPFFGFVENTPPNTVLNRGFLIQASSPISAYYEILGETPNNPEIFALKGKNALGTNFFTPFQNLIDNSSSYFPTPYAAFDIVATENNTQVTITPTQALVGHAANAPFTITLDRGQTYSAQAVSQSSFQHPAGSRVVATKPVAITVKDDLLEGGQIAVGTCRDVVGDQIVPVEKLGTKYVVQKGFLNSDERVYVLATQPSTDISFDGTFQGTMNLGDTWEISVSAGSHFLETSAPVYVFQLTGTNCELAGATLPALDCGGSSSVRFVRTTGEDFYLFLVTKNGNQSGFTLNGSSSLLPASDFQAVPGSNGEYVAGVFSFADFQVPTGQSSVVENSLGTFQLAFLNGGVNTGCRFGYFSDFCKESPISTIINDYTPVTYFSGCDSTVLEVGTTAGFSPNDKVLIIQMKGATVDLSSTANFGNITNPGSAGNFEFNRIKSIFGNQITLFYKPEKNYDASSKVQLVRVPEYDNCTTTDQLTCQPWDGSTGGVLVLDVAGTLTLQNNLDVSEKGFRGGTVMNSAGGGAYHETEQYYPPDPFLAAEKGEGIAEIPVSQSYGRGKAANGGGGGNGHNGGGGGGGNGGAGGNGGLEYWFAPNSPTLETDGIGGLRVFETNNQKITLGGGGGAGHTNDNVGTSGGNGGGIIILKANNIVVSGGGATLAANGEDIITTGNLNNDGQGGGGAGGAILIEANQITGSLNCELKGGRGGNCLFYVEEQIIGPGGGGGGGKLMLSQNFPNVTADLNGGINGITNQNQTNGAQPGQSGVLLTGAGVLEDTMPGGFIFIEQTIEFCPGTSVTIGGVEYDQSGVVIDTISGTVGCDTIATYTLVLLPQPTLFATVEFCPGSSVTIGGIEYNQPGIVVDTIPATVGCSTIATYTLVLLPQPTLSTTVEFCPGSSVTIGGIEYDQPGIVVDTIPGVTGCDTLATYVLVPLTPAPSTVTLVCPADLTVNTEPAVATYAPPVAASDCVCPGISLQLTGGLPSGSVFPGGATQVCYVAKDSCGNTASCCFKVTVPDEEPCSQATIGCVKYELYTIHKDAAGHKTYRIRVTNNCTNKLMYAAFELPLGVVALAPANNSVYTAPSGREYTVRNPNYAPFYSIRFKSSAAGMANGESDLFEFTLPTNANPAHIQVVVRVEPKIFYSAYLHTINCPVETVSRPVEQAAEASLDREVAGAGKLPNLRVSPNPTNGVFYADLSDWQTEQVRVQIVDSRGQRVQQLTTTADAAPQEIALPKNLANGLYFIEVITEQGEKVAARFILQRG